jgi:hypothetical protein
VIEAIVQGRGFMKTGFDPHRYADLLVKYHPAVIETEEENERLTQAAGRLMKKGAFARGRQAAESAGDADRGF